MNGINKDIVQFNNEENKGLSNKELGELISKMK
jgi:hypothetical protein